jgi:DNA-binding CsgD family transcriptional regulator
MKTVLTVIKENPQLKLSVREVEVLLCCASGKTIQETAEFLTISYSTAKTHRENIRNRFRLNGNYGIKHFADKYQEEFEQFLNLSKKSIDIEIKV